ncbi:MAG: hypothetical protein V4508_21170 [Pseudomonadota bacterium]
MNIVHDKKHAAASAPFCGRYCLVRRVVFGCALCCASLAPALAGPAEKEREAPQRNGQAHERVPARENVRTERPQQQPAARPAEAARSDPRQFDPRSFDARADEQRRMQQAQQDQATRNNEAFRRSGRLTPDERRDLRRQINEAGLDIYPNTPRR